MNNNRITVSTNGKQRPRGTTAKTGVSITLNGTKQRTGGRTFKPKNSNTFRKGKYSKSFQGAKQKTSRYPNNSVHKSLASKDAADYLLTVMDPSNQHNVVGIPSQFPIKTAVNKFSFEGTFNCNAGGYFQLICDPWNADQTLILLNGATLSTQMSQTSQATLIAAFNDKLPATAYGEYRIVACSLKTHVVNPGAMTSGYLQNAFMMLRPDAANIGQAVGYTDDQMEESGITKEYLPTDKNEVCYRPIDPTDLEFGDYGDSSTRLVVAGWSLKNAYTDLPASLKYKLTIVIEFIPSSNNYLSESKFGSSDTRGIEALSAITASKTNWTLSEPEDDASWLQEMTSVLSDIESSATGKFIGEAASAIWNNPITSAIGQAAGKMALSAFL